ncbi:hypothetical protein DRN75_01245 [Nanoarchaeota archaeon]|nr:MAG: hypothetical protein DRN75_01245 [Nanoarchaeota archaeon]
MRGTVDYIIVLKGRKPNELEKYRRENNIVVSLGYGPQFRVWRGNLAAGVHAYDWTDTIVNIRLKPGELRVGNVRLRVPKEYILVLKHTPNENFGLPVLSLDDLLK